MGENLVAAIRANTEQVQRLAEAIEGMTVILAADMGAEGEQGNEQAEQSTYMDGSPL